jgi:two-component system, OmpR family, sensor kinase
MKRLWFATRLAAAFGLVGICFAVATGMLARYTLGDRVHENLVSLRTAEALLIAFELEASPGGDAREVMARLARERSRDLALLDERGRVIASSSSALDGLDAATAEPTRCGDRTCQLLGRPPGRVVIVPLRLGSGPHALAVAHRLPEPGDLLHFGLGLLALTAVALLAVVAISWRVTRPLRQVSRSMDRVAGGDLEHRVEVRGRDEVARMGISFNAMADRVSAMVRSGKELLAGVSHELRSPLARIKVSLELLRADGAPGRHVQSIDDDVDALDALVDELLTASRLDLGTATLRCEPVALAALVEEGAARMQGSRDGAAAELEIRLDPPDLEVEVDRALGARLVGNLLENAARYGEGSPVTVTARREGERAVVEVRDRGPGVPEDALGSLFRPFFRVDTSRSRRTGGTGLGLMIARRAVEAHGGEIAASNATGGGLAVTFDLPLASARRTSS